jgi:type I restriction enzyme S subunit
MIERNLKAGWRRVKFGDVVRLSKGRSKDPLADGIERYVGLEHLEPGDLRIRSWGNVADGVTFTSLFQPGQVLFGKRRAYQRKVAVADFSGVCSGDIYVLETKAPQVLLPELLPFICQTDAFFEHAVGTSAGSLSPRTNWTSLADFEFALPSMEEQQRTIRLLSSIEDQVETVLQALTASTKLRKSIARDAFSKSDYPKIKMGSVADIRNGSTPRRVNNEYWKGEIPWLPTGKVNDRVIRAADEFITEKALSECPLTLIPAGATLVAMIGEGQTRGRAAMLVIDSCINHNFGAVIPGASLDPWYLFYLLESSYEALRHWSQGTNQHALSCGLLKSFPIPVPPLEVQQGLVIQLKEIEATERQLESRLNAAYEMRRAAHLTALSME